MNLRTPLLLAGLAAASGLETNGRQINRAACFAAFNVPGPAPVPIPPQNMTLKAPCAALDAGAILPNINDGFVGTAPDLGAYELGRPVPTYGPRPAAQLPAPANVRLIFLPSANRPCAIPPVAWGSKLSASTQRRAGSTIWNMTALGSAI